MIFDLDPDAVLLVFVGRLVLETHDKRVLANLAVLVGGRDSWHD